MNILLIAPASGYWHHVGHRKFFNGKTFRFSMLSLLAVAADSPPNVNIQIIDEQVDEVPWDDSLDLVGITCMTAAAPRAYEIAGYFRNRSIPVVLGGMHPTFCPDEASQHADAIVMGEAEGLWSHVVRDARNQCLRKFYSHTQLPALNGIKLPPRKLLNGGKYSTIHAVQATRGCPHRCDFCSITAFNQGSQRYRPIDEVIAEIANIPRRFFMFVDDNLTTDKEYAYQLFRKLIPLKKRWVTQTTLAIAEDKKLVSLAAKAGCVGVFIGMETFSKKNLHSVNKEFNRVEKYQTAIETLHGEGIGVEAGIVFGFDHDEPKVFERSLKVMDDLKIDAAQISIYTPLPGTPRFENINNRIIDFDWSHYDFHHTVFRPTNMSAEDLKDGHDWITNRFYSLGRILLRAWRSLWRPNGLRMLPFFLSVNLAYYGRVRIWRIKGRNPSVLKKPAGRPGDAVVTNKAVGFGYNGL